MPSLSVGLINHLSFPPELLFIPRSEAVCPSVCTSISRSVCLFILYVYLRFSLPFFLFSFWQFVYLFVCLRVCVRLPVYSFRSSINFSKILVHLSFCVFVIRFVCLLVWLYFCQETDSHLEPKPESRIEFCGWVKAFISSRGSELRLTCNYNLIKFRSLSKRIICLFVKFCLWLANHFATEYLLETYWNTCFWWSEREDHSITGWRNVMN